MHLASLQLDEGHPELALAPAERAADIVLSEPASLARVRLLTSQICEGLGRLDELAMTTPGDTSMASLSEVEHLMKGGGARVVR
jgi:hypothetical protein